MCFSVPKDETLFIMSTCKHIVCKPCTQYWLKVQIEDNKTFEFECLKCKEEKKLKPLIADKDISDLVPELNDFRRKKQIESVMNANPNLKQCPTPDCEGVFEVEDNLFNCDLCGIHFCLTCKVNWNPNHNCEEHEAIKVDD